MAATGDCKSLLRLSDKKTLANARQFAKKYETELSDMKRNFSEEGSFGLWWDQIGLFKSSDPTEVREKLEEFRKLAENFSNVTVSVEEGERNSYEKLLEFYDKLKEKEEEAELGSEQSKSKTVVRMYRNFLQKTVEMDRKLSKVECVAQRRIIDDSKNAMHEAKIEANDAKQQCETLKKEKKDLVTRNEKAEEVIKQHESLQLENEKFREALIKSNEEAVKRSEAFQQERETLMQSNKEANRRCEALHQENQKLRETLEESSKKADERSLILIQENKKLMENLEESNKRADERNEILIQENEKLRERLEESNRKADERMLRLLEIIKQRQN